MNPMRGILLWASRSTQLQDRLPKYGGVRRAVRRFMPGETLDDALSAAKQLQSQGITTVLTCLGENISQRHEADAVASHYLHVLEAIEASGLDCHISVKLTQLGFDLDEAVCRRHMESLSRSAAARGNFIWIDMEGSDYVDRTIELFKQLRETSANVGLCLQAYLFRTGADLGDLLTRHAVIRLVKGAYAEPKQIAFAKKRDVDENYFALAKRILSSETNRSGMKPGIATHDPVLVRRVQREMQALGRPKQACEFQLLYGIRRDQQQQLADEGYAVRVLISYGTFWFPWYMRRLAERPANVLFVLRNLIHEPRYNRPS